MSASGVVYLVGAGPGDPGLLTLRGAELLVTADAVVYDALANPALLGLASAAGRTAPVEMYDAGKRGGGDSASQDDINSLLIRLADEGKRVVRLKGGDPLVFGRGSEEAQALADAGVTFEIVPGVTAGIAAPAYAGIPVTHRGVSTTVTFVTGHEDPAKETSTITWWALARAGGTIVLYMGVKTLPRIVEALINGGRSPDTPAAAIQWGTHPHQRTIVATLGTLCDVIAEHEFTAPVITVIGDVVSLRDQIAWFDRRPLFGKRIVVTRARSQAATLGDRLAAAGAQVVDMPATRIEPVADSEQIRKAIDRLADYDWAIFTSQNAVELFWDALRRMGRDARAFAGVKLAAVGPATAAALLERGLSVDITPERFVAEALLEALKARQMRGKLVLYAAAEGARQTLPEGLAERGAIVDRVTLYKSVPDGEGASQLRDMLLIGDIDLVTFTSASAVRAFVGAVGEDAARRAPAASIGPITSEAALAAGLDVAIEASTSTIPGLVDAISAAFVNSEGTATSDSSLRSE